MRFFLVILLCVLYTLSAKGQTPYKGGEGDGHTMASMTLEVINSIDVNRLPVQVYPNVLTPEQSFKVDNNAAVKEISLIGIQGVLFYVIRRSDQYFVPGGTPPGLYFLLIKTADQIQYSRLTVIDP